MPSKSNIPAQQLVDVTFVVSCCNDPEKLICCLASLSIQYGNNEIFVADNSTNRSKIEDITKLCAQFRVKYRHTKMNSCYEPIEKILRAEGSGEWVCFPSSDGYYVPGFTEIMLSTARKNNFDLVYCDMLYDPRLHGRGIYSVLSVFPELRWIDKTCFILKQNKFNGFPQHEQDWRDGALIEKLVRSGIKHGKAKGVLVVHN